MNLGFEVVELPPHDAPSEGDEAPDFTRPLVNEEYWEDASLSELAADAERVVLIFHPMDGAFPSTYIWNEVRDREWKDKATVVGVSVSTPYEHKTFIEEREMGGDYRLFSDPQNGVAEEYGVVNDLDGMAGVSEARPAVFVIEDMEVEYAWVAEEWPEFPPYGEVEDAIDA